MLSIYRLANRSCGKINFNQLEKSIIIPSRSVTLKVVPGSSLPQEEDFFEKNEKLKRPQSPHLTIYKPQITTVLSITHRATGIALAAYVSAFGIGALILPHDWPHYISALAAVAPFKLFLGKSFVAFPFTYHFWNGIRHLGWDGGKFFKIKEVYTTGYLVLGVSAASAFLLCLL